MTLAFMKMFWKMFFLKCKTENKLLMTSIYCHLREKYPSNVSKIICHELNNFIPMYII